MQAMIRTSRSSRVLSYPNGSGSRRYTYVGSFTLVDVVGGYVGLTRSPALRPRTMEPGDG